MMIIVEQRILKGGFLCICGICFKVFSKMMKAGSRCECGGGWKLDEEVDNFCVFCRRKLERAEESCGGITCESKCSPFLLNSCIVFFFFAIV